MGALVCADCGHAGWNHQVDSASGAYYCNGSLSCMCGGFQSACPSFGGAAPAVPASPSSTASTKHPARSLPPPNPFRPSPHSLAPYSGQRGSPAPEVKLTAFEAWRALHAGHKTGPYLDCIIGEYQQWHCPCGDRRKEKRC